MKIIVGLGNPGRKYEKTRHNLGFRLLDAFRDTFSGNFSAFTSNAKLKAVLSEGRIEQEKVLLIKPGDFYNNSGSIIGGVLKYFDATADDLIVAHDDLDIPLGQMRIARGSSAAGNNGVQSIIDALGSKDFIRLRLGIRSDIKDKMDAQDFVLKKFSRQEIKHIKDLLPRAQQALIDLIEYYPDIERVQNMHH